MLYDVCSTDPNNQPPLQVKIPKLQVGRLERVVGGIREVYFSRKWVSVALRTIFPLMDGDYPSLGPTMMFSCVQNIPDSPILLTYQCVLVYASSCPQFLPRDFSWPPLVASRSKFHCAMFFYSFLWNRIYPNPDVTIHLVGLKPP